MKFTVTKFFAEKIYNNTVIDRAEVGITVVNNGTISAIRYDELMKAAKKHFGEPAPSTYYSLVTEDGRRSTFHGYKASDALTLVSFV